MLRSVYVFAGTLLLGLISVAVTSYLSPALSIAWALAAGALGFLFAKMIESISGDELNELVPMTIAGAAIAFGGGFKWLIGSAGAGWHDWIAVLAAMGSAWGADILLTSTAGAECFVCKQQVEGSSFTCPRCQQHICSRPTCWFARHFRCRLCEERDVILFPLDERWWKARLGARARTGACSSCQKEAVERDLRECGQCRWPMCRPCWDYHNGRCTRCLWTIPDPPAALLPFLGPQAARPAAQPRSPAWRRP